jgi:hypothetical protein
VGQSMVCAGGVRRRCAPVKALTVVHQSSIGILEFMDEEEKVGPTIKYLIKFFYVLNIIL